MKKGFFGDVKDGKFWRDLDKRTDAIFKITDMQAHEDALNRGDGMNVEDRTVNEIRRYVHVNFNAEWIFFVLSGPQTIYLMVRVFDNDANAYVLFSEDPDDNPILIPGSREELIERGDLFLFEEPEDEHDFIPAELELVFNFLQNMPNSKGEEVEVEFCQESMGTQFTGLSMSPKDKDIDGCLCGITEYVTDSDVDNPLFVFVEEGIDWDPDDSEGKTEGGYCSFYAGCKIDMADIEISLP